MRNSILAAVAVTSAIAALPASAGAHAAVVSRTPAPDSTLASAKTVRITFSEAVVTGRLTLTRGGARVAVGRLTNHRRSLSITRSRSLASGSYKVTWSARSDDGHRESGTWKFSVQR